MSELHEVKYVTMEHMPENLEKFYEEISRMSVDQLKAMVMYLFINTQCIPNVTFTEAIASHKITTLAELDMILLGISVMVMDEYQAVKAQYAKSMYEVTKRLLMKSEDTREEQLVKSMQELEDILYQAGIPEEDRERIRECARTSIELGGGLIISGGNGIIFKAGDPD